MTLKPRAVSRMRQLIAQHCLCGMKRRHLFLFDQIMQAMQREAMGRKCV